MPTREGPSPGALHVPWAWLLASLLLVASVWLTGQVLGARGEREALETSRALAQAAREMAEIQLAERTLLAERAISELGRKLQQREDVGRMAAAQLKGAGIHVLVIWHRELRTGIAVVEALPPLADDQDYQLWIREAPGRQPIRCCLLVPAAAGAPLLQPFAADLAPASPWEFLLSREHKGGAREPKGEVLAAAMLPER